MKDQEKKLQEEILKLESNLQNIDNIYSSQRDKVTNIADKIKDQKDNTSLKNRMFEEKAERLANLRSKRDNLEVQRQSIGNALGDLKAGDYRSYANANKD
jgi:septal ring factor EnvC (AmiA/AmiB activator)